MAVSSPQQNNVLAVARGDAKRCVQIGTLTIGFEGSIEKVDNVFHKCAGMKNEQRLSMNDGIRHAADGPVCVTLHFCLRQMI